MSIPAELAKDLISFIPHATLRLSLNRNCIRKLCCSNRLDTMWVSKCFFAPFYPLIFNSSLQFRMVGIDLKFRASIYWIWYLYIHCSFWIQFNLFSSLLYPLIRVCTRWKLGLGRKI